MNYIEKIHIEGFKRFSYFDVCFDKGKNIIVGENETGKSTLLEAIRIVLSQKYKNVDKSILKDLFNKKSIDIFEQNPHISNLPKILIEIDLKLESDNIRSIDFFGENNKDKKDKYGISFRCEFNEDFAEELAEAISNKKIPYEYYDLTWTNYSGKPFSVLKKPLNYLAIDTSTTDAQSSFNYYNKALFFNRYDNSTRMMTRSKFRDGLETIFEEQLKLEDIDENRKFGIDTKKVILESVINVIENKIPLENKGSGMENLIKTEIALSKKDSIDVITLEEPENHLSYSNMKKMIESILEKTNSQLIITTHNDMIASRLNLKNVMWIEENSTGNLANLDDTIALFFEKTDTNNLLHFILSKRVILVEGPTEYILIPKFYKQITEKTIEEDGVSVISCNGVSYKNYLKIGELLSKKVSVITDNDKKQSKIDEINSYNQSSATVKIFSEENLDEWTWEVCLYHINKEKLDKLFPVKKGCKYLIGNDEKPETKNLGWMINNKLECAYTIMVNDSISFKIPKYVEKAIKWINE